MKPKKINPGEEFIIHGTVYSYSLVDDKPVIKALRTATEKKKPDIPSEEEIKEYAKKNGYDPNFMWEKAKGYIDADMEDSRGNKIVNLKLKLNQVWFKPEFKIKEEPTKKVTNFYQKND